LIDTLEHAGVKKGQGSTKACIKCSFQFPASRHNCPQCLANQQLLQDKVWAEKAFRTKRGSGTIKRIRKQLRQYAAEAYGRSGYKMNIVIMESCSWMKRSVCNVYGMYCSCSLRKHPFFVT
jgi:hypothetical protein